MAIIPFMLVQVQNRQGLLNVLRCSQFSPLDFESLDAPDAIPSGGMKSWTSCVYPVVQGVVQREEA